MLQPIPVESNSTTDLMKRAMRSQIKPLLPYLSRARLEQGMQQIQEGYRKRQLLPVEQELLREMERLLARN